MTRRRAPETHSPRVNAGARRVRIASAVAVVALAAFAATVPTIFNGFIALYDDGDNYLRNPFFRGLGRPQLLWAWSTVLLGTYQPLGWMLLEAEYATCGLEPWGYHLASVALHCANAVALFALCVAVLDRIAPEGRTWNRTSAALAGALFAVHPLRVEAVAWASCQPYLPGFLFALLAVLAYLAAHPPALPTRPGWLVAAWLLWAVSLLFKAIALTLPLVLLVIDVYPLRRIDGARGLWRGPAVRRVWVEKLPFFALSALFVAVAAHAKQNGIRMPALPDGFAERVTQASYATCFYLIKTLWPAGLSADYPLPTRPHALAPWYVASLVAVAGISAAVVRLRRRWPGLAAAWAIYLITLAPTSGLIRTNSQVATDRYSYLPSMPGVVVLAYVLSQMGPSAAGQRAVLAGGAAALAVLTSMSWRQCQAWRDDVTLFTRAVAVSPREPQALVYLGAALERQGRFAEAEAHYLRAVAIEPRFSSALNNLGILRFREQHYEAAKARFRAALTHDPGSVEANTNLGIVLAAEGRWSDAVSSYETALRLHPDYANAHRGIAEALAKMGRSGEALRHRAAAVRLAPLNAAAPSALRDDLEHRPPAWETNPPLSR